jgi:diadenosine tetraphosphate (Ap4A) HIT family hydrolase
MVMSPAEFHAHALRAADTEHRLPLARMTGWDVAPFEQQGLRTVPLQPPVAPEPPRADEDAASCATCAARDVGVWLDEHWRLRRMAGVGVPLALLLLPRAHFDLADLPDERAAELGILTAHIARHVEALPHIARAHVYRIGDGGAHVHVWFFARPEGQVQLRGSWLPVWDDLLPEYPDELAATDAAAVAGALAASYGGRVNAAG